ncbi:MAG: hypothetical protein MUC50_00870 [Myxococcota bacterium]|jgi:hypothetical protein|nr:hypothetical protein [Myxococcota bacterium]
MTPLEDEAHALPIAHGAGDFQHKNAYARATIEIREGRISATEFVDEHGAQIPGAGALRRLLEGQTIAKALEVTPESVGETGATELSTTVCMVLIEAFHRAVESCFDAE